MSASYKSKGTGLQSSKTNNPAQLRPLSTAGFKRTDNPNREDMSGHSISKAKMAKGTRKGEY